MQIVLEMQRKPIEQFRMAWLLANAAEILKSFDDPRPEQLFPVTIHGGTRGQRLPRGKEPFCESQSIARRSFGQSWKNSRYVGNQRRPDLGEKVAALEFQRGSLVVVRFLSHDRYGNGRNLIQLAGQFCEFCKFLTPAGVVGKCLPECVFTY